LSRITLKTVIDLLKTYTLEEKKQLKIILLGGLALACYGMKDRKTIDVDAEVDGDLESLFLYLKRQKIPSDLSENISAWSVIAMPPDYRDRAISIFHSPTLEVRALAPTDFVISKLRRFTEEDIEDALFVIKKYHLDSDQISLAANAAIQHSIKDTMLFLFKKNVGLFLKKMDK